MNFLLLGTILFVIVYLLLNWFVRASSKTIASGTRKIILALSLILAFLLTYAGRFLFSVPLLLIFLNALKIKGLSTFQIFQLWRLIQFLRSTGRFSYGSRNSFNSSSVSIEESYKILGLKRGCTKEQVIKATNQLQKKIHPDLNRDTNTERLSQLVNEAKDKILKEDFS
ncbi:MAG: J domain-containing protein [Pelagibacteraceae bacterium]